MFETKKNEGFPQREERIQKFWDEQKIFKKSVDAREGKELFSFYDGPPFATGLPHYGHLLAGTIKDVVPRYQTMKGYYVPRRFGWDCHGLPVENEIEKEKKLFGAKSIEDFGIANFNDECASIVLRYTKEWKRTVERMGRWVDFSSTYHTMDLSFMESVWWVFKQLNDKGLVYEGFKVMPFSAQLGTPLSNFEANLNYKEVDDPSLTVIFPVDDEENTYFLAWTTTPWTLVSNLGLAVGEGLEYVKVKEKSSDRFFYIARALKGKYFQEDEIEVIDTFLGKKLVGKRYEPILPYFKDQKAKGAFKVIAGDFVTLEDGTGIVHMAPAFGEVDFYACKEAGMGIVCPVDNNGKFTDEVPDYKDIYVKDADKAIIRSLKEKKLVFKHATIRHRYPFCWRSDTPLIYKAVKTWFVAVEKIKDKLIEANKKIHWVPDHIKGGRFGKWLENARDWAISRNRYWGTPIPIWRGDKGNIQVIGSVEELEEKCGKKITDLHRHHIDELTFEEDGEIFTRIPEVFDCWFESGSMPYAQNHYPFENKDRTEKGFPADFIAEGLDQTRGWFYTLNVLSVALFDQPAFKNVIVNGILLAEDGNKMSKRHKNYPEPGEVINQYGADAIRLYMLHSPAVKGDDLRFCKRGVELILRQALIPLWNAFSFLSTYAEIYDWKPTRESADINKKPEAVIDQWIRSQIYKLAAEVEEQMEKYDLSKAVEPMVGFIDQLTNWYIRRSRSRFWADEDSQDRREAFETLYHVLLTFAKIAAPFIPFITEAIYQELKIDGMEDSVHLCDFPSSSQELRDVELEKEMGYVQRAVSIGHSLRKEHRLKVRQPLAKAHVIAGKPDVLSFLQKQKNLIADELNVKEVEFHADEIHFISLVAKPNFPVLGKKVGKLMKAAQKEITKLTAEQMKKLQDNEKVVIDVEGEKIKLSSEDVMIERKVVEGIAAGNDADIAIAIDTNLTEDLIQEALAREIVNKLNTMRREQNFEVTDRIEVLIESDEAVSVCYDAFKDYINHETLAQNFEFTKKCKGTEWDLNGHKAIIQIRRSEFV